MTTAALVLLAAAAATAVGNWVAVARESRALEYVCKPATMTLLVGVALTLDPAEPAQRWWFVGALVLSLAGDVFLMLPNDRFLPGVGAFLLAHLAYVGGFVVVGIELAGGLVGAALTLVAVIAVGRPLLQALQRGPHQPLTVPVGVYLIAISAMVVAAFGTWQALAIAGALSFYISDAVIGWTRFVRPIPGGPVVIMVTYHVGQALLVLSLLA